MVAKARYTAILALVLATAPDQALSADLANAADAQNRGPIEEIVVTATRREDSVNKVPLSISAVTAEAMDRQSIRDAVELERKVPALTIRRVGGDAGATIAIRGIYSTVGGATTGVYLDDVPLHKRFAQGGIPGNGSPLPALFDLERVEVLRGPQGTLYGGSTQGGAIRFITPEPDLQQALFYTRSELSQMDTGGLGYDVGGALGLPIVPNKVGLRPAGAWHRGPGGEGHEQFGKLSSSCCRPLADYRRTQHHARVLQLTYIQ